MLRFALGFLVVSGVGLANPSELGRSGLGVAVARADPSADDCVGFDKRDAEKGIEYSLRNECDKKLACSLSWKVSCEDGAGKVTQSRNVSQHFSVAESEEKSVVASASECKAGWRIDAVSWSCGEAH